MTVAKPAIIVAPYPRTINEIFDSATWARLTDIADVVWGRDDPIPADRFSSELVDAEAVAFGSWDFPRDVLQGAGNDLKALFEVMGTLDHQGLDYETCFDRGIAVGSVAPAFGSVVAEMCLALALSALRGVAVSDRLFRSGGELYLHAGNVGSGSLIGATVGFVGCGSISRHLQALCEPFGVEVLGYDPWLEASEFEQRHIEPVALDDLFDRSKVVFVLAVPTPENAGMLSRQLMERLDPHDVLVLASRSHVVDFVALTELLLAGRFRAGIDVFPQEPLPGDHPIRGADGAVLTAHLAGALPEALHGIGRMIVGDLEAVLADRSPSSLQYATPEMVASLQRSGRTTP